MLLGIEDVLTGPAHERASAYSRHLGRVMSFQSRIDTKSRMKLVECRATETDGSRSQ